ncbi:hypothetical protein HOY82DRAFT_159747 [Tuber indicum]|nr:hypothetical protein HOY82DRAFT_159747 [Tuber indicum]
MAFRDSNPLGALATGGQEGQPQAQLVGGVQQFEVVLENLGFLGLNGETRVKLFAQGYNTDSVPIPSASLFAIANKRGLFAAATSYRWKHLIPSRSFRQHHPKDCIL